MRMTEACAIVNAIVAPKANRPPSSVDVGRDDQPERDHRGGTIATCGVCERRLSLPSQLGIWRLVAST